MKLLLDGNLPHRLRALIVGHEVFTVAYMKWKGVENGELLARAASAGFDALVTKDSGIPYEQSASTLPCSLIILQAASNAMRDIEPLIPALHDALRSLHPRTVVRVG